MKTPPAFQIVHADEHLVVVDKDAGLLTTPAHGEACLVDQLEAALDRERFGRFRLSVVHRLDRQTSGLLVFARTPKIAAALSKQLAGHRFEREYVAIVAGALAEASGTIRFKLDGKHAVTHFEALNAAAGTTTVAVRLETGRRNQIRLHFAGLEHPVLGDTRFSPELARHAAWPHARLALHARVLGFVHPALRTTLRFEAPLPEAFRLFAAQNANPAR